MPDPYISEVKYKGGPTLDFIEVAVDAGTDVSNLVVTVYFANGNIRSSNSLAGLTSTNIAGRDVYVIQTGAPSSFSGVATTNAIALSDSGTVYSFISFDDNAATVSPTTGPAAGLTSTDVGIAGAGESLETTDRGASYFTQTAPNSGTIPCLVEGTLVQTEGGAKRVEDLVEDDLLETLSGEMKPLRKALRKSLNAKDLRANPKLYPICISAHSLGHGLPTRDLWVSRQHRMLVQSPIVKRIFGVEAVLVPAIKLLALPGIYIDRSVRQLSYFHLLFDAHEVIFAEGAPTESLFLGEQTLNALPAQVLQEITALFPQFASAANINDAAYLVPKGQRQKQLIARHAKNSMPLLKDYAPNREQA